MNEPLLIAVTGGAGHVGTGVVRHALSEGHSVIALDRGVEGKLPPQDRYSYKQVNVVDFEAYKAAVRGCTALIHLAAVYNQHDDEGISTDEVQQHVIPVLRCYVDCFVDCAQR